MSKLFTPARLGRYSLDHRVALAPMPRLRTLQPRDIPSPMTADFYGQRASKGGLVIIEGTSISIGARSYLGAASFYHDGQAEGWQAVADAIHAKGGIAFMQLIHGGRQSHVDMTGGVAPVVPFDATMLTVADRKPGSLPARDPRGPDLGLRPGWRRRAHLAVGRMGRHLGQ